MELPDFDTLRRLAVEEPERLEELLRQQIEALIDRVGPEQQQRLRGLQFRIDCQRQLAKNSLDSCIRISAMMHDSFYSLRRELNQFTTHLYPRQTPAYAYREKRENRGNKKNKENKENRGNRKNNVISLRDYPRTEK